MIVGITRVRNEALIVRDTLDHFLRWCDEIIVYDDCSTDATAQIAESFDRVTLIRGSQWSLDRTAEETRHRAMLLERARAAGATWCLCFDADERIEGDMPDLSAASAFRFRLFDAYLTPGCPEYCDGPLADLDRLYGPEYRDILMLFRADQACFVGRDQREPQIDGRVSLAPIRVKHFGKGISVEQWEETCRYYAEHFPEPYISKWSARKGKAIHDQSDFGRPLHRWDDLPAHEVPMR